MKPLFPLCAACLHAGILLFHSSTAHGAASIATFAGNGQKGFSGDRSPARSAQLNDPGGIARGPDGFLYICDTANHRIRRVAPNGSISTFAGTGEPGWSGDGGAALSARLHEPYEVRFDKEGNVYWVERLSHSVRKVDIKTLRIATVAGNGTAGFSGDGGPGTQAQLNDPHSIAFDPHGGLYIADVRNHRIRKLDPKTGILTTFSGNGERKTTPDGAPIGGAPLHGPRAMDFDRSGNLWLALREGNAVLKFDLANGTIHTVAGDGTKGASGDNGPASSAKLNGPKGVSVAPDGNVYIADTENQVIRMIHTGKGSIHRVAGTGTAGDGMDGDPLQCQLARPHGIFVDQDGSIYIGDTEAHRVRVIRNP